MGDCHGDRIVPVQSVPITTKIVSSNPAHGEVYSIQDYVIKCVSNLWQDNGFFLSGTPVSSTNKTDRHNIAEILLNSSLNTITRTLPPLEFYVTKYVVVV